MAEENKAKYANTIIRPKVTEKSSFLTPEGVYTFDISPEAQKAEIKSAIKAFYGVTPVKVRIVNSRGKRVFMRGKFLEGKKSRKAYVYLKEGDKIE